MRDTCLRGQTARTFRGQGSMAQKSRASPLRPFFSGCEHAGYSALSLIRRCPEAAHGGPIALPKAGRHDHVRTRIHQALLFSGRYLPVYDEHMAEPLTAACPVQRKDQLPKAGSHNCGNTRTALWVALYTPSGARFLVNVSIRAKRDEHPMTTSMDL